MTLPTPPIVLLEGNDHATFATLDELTAWVEAIDVRNGEFVVLDGEGPEVELAAASDLAHVTARVGEEQDPDRLSAVVRNIVRQRPRHYAVVDADAETSTLLRAIWSADHPRRPFPRDIGER